MSEVWGEVMSCCDAEDFEGAIMALAGASSVDNVAMMAKHIQDQIRLAQARCHDGWAVVGNDRSPCGWAVYFKGSRLEGITRLELEFDANEHPKMVLTVLPDAFWATGVREALGLEVKDG